MKMEKVFLGVRYRFEDDAFFVNEKRIPYTDVRIITRNEKMSGAFRLVIKISDSEKYTIDIPKTEKEDAEVIYRHILEVATTRKEQEREVSKESVSVETPPIHAQQTTASSTTDKDIKEIAKDIKTIKNIIVVFAILYVLGFIATMAASCDAFGAGYY